MNQLISIFILVLVVSILIGITFLFVSSLKSNVVSSTITTNTISSEVGYINQTGYQLLSNADSDVLLGNYIITSATNRTNGAAIVVSGNITVSATGLVTNASSIIWNNATISYTYTGVPPTTYDAVNQTESAGATIVNYLPLIFLALIFGAILIVVLRVILPYINVSQGISGTEI